MYRNNSSRVFSTILIIIVVIAIVIGLVSLVRYAMGAGNEASNEPNAQEQARSALLNTAEGYSVRVTARGPLVADERFVMQRVSISPSERKAFVYQGYMKSVKRKIVLGNTPAAYDQFVNALDKGEFTKLTKQDNEGEIDIRGICASGRVYEYEIMYGNEAVHYGWTSTCKGSPGNFGANLTYINNLFTAQIPDGSFEFAKYKGDN